MHLEVSQTRSNGFTEVAAVHKGQRLLFSVSTYGKVKLDDPNKVFTEINSYWEWMGEECQERVWTAYNEIKSIMDVSMDQFHSLKYIRKNIVLMYQAMPMDSFSKWLLTKGNLYIPSDIKESIPEDSRHTRADQTYLTEDYINLSTMALAIRPALPIWGEFIDQGGAGLGDTLNKEMEAIGLVADTEIFKWPSEKEAFDKLLNYIKIGTDDSPVALNTIWKGVSSEEVPLWFLSKVLVRRLTIVPLCDHTVSHSIIANVYRYVRSLLKPTDRRTVDRVNEKQPEREGRDEDDKTSFLESYKVKQRVANGDVVLYSVSSENMVGLAQKVDPMFDIRLLESTTKLLPKMDNMRVHPHQLRLAQWVLAKGFPPRAMHHLPKPAVNRLLVTAQALLWHWGFADLACLMQVDRNKSDDPHMASISQQPKGSPRISRRYVDELMTHFPHVKPQKQRASDTDNTNRNGNIAAVGINNITKLIMGGNWVFYGSAELRRQAGQPEGRGLLVVPPTIKNRITELVLHLAKINS